MAAEDNAHLLAKSRQKIHRAGWSNVQLSGDLDPAAFGRGVVDGVIVSYNPPILLQRPDLLGAAWGLLKPGGRMSLVAGRCTTFAGRLAGAMFVRPGLALFGHGDDYHYWRVHEPWKDLERLAEGRVRVEARLGFQYLLWSEKAT